MKQCLLKLLRPLNAFLILSQCAAAYTQCAAAYTHCAAAYTHCAAAYTHGAAAYMLCAAAYMVKVRIKLTQSSWAGAGTELGNRVPSYDSMSGPTNGREGKTEGKKVFRCTMQRYKQQH